MSCSRFVPRRIGTAFGSDQKLPFRTGTRLKAALLYHSAQISLRLPLWELIRQIEERAYQHNKFPSAEIRKPGRERRQDPIDWNRELEVISTKGRNKALKGLLLMLEENKELLQQTSAEDLLQLWLQNREQDSEK